MSNQGLKSFRRELTINGKTFLVIRGQQGYGLPDLVEVSCNGSTVGVWTVPINLSYAECELQVIASF